MAAESSRLISLDVFRGMTIFLMIVVNTPGSGAVPFSPLLHAEWHGFTLTDLVFPSFLFAVGNAIPFATKKWQHSSASLRMRKIFQRAVLIFLVGYLLNWYTSMHFVDGERVVFTSFDHLRIPGVLQRIALCYLLAALLTQYCSNLQLIFISVLILLGYWLLLYLGGDATGPYSVTGNLVRKIDLKLIGERFMYRERGVVFDPEGLISTLPATVNVLAGVLCGRFILQKRASSETTIMLLASGSILILAAICWAWFFPLNKKLWTSSFVLLTTGIDLLVICALYTIESTDTPFYSARFFSIPGRNPLAIYVFSNLLLIFFIFPVNNMDLYTYFNLSFIQSWLPGPWGSLFFAILVALLCWSFGWILDKRKIYIRL